MIKEEELPPPTQWCGGVVGGVPGGVAGGTPGGVLGGIIGRFPRRLLRLRLLPKKVEEKPADAAAHQSRRQRAAGQADRGSRIPMYPPLAKQARIQGTVKLNAIIAKDGTIQNLKSSAAIRCWSRRPSKR